MAVSLFHDRCLYHIKTSPLICIANQYTGFNMIGTSVMKELVLEACLFIINCVKNILYLILQESQPISYCIYGNFCNSIYNMIQHMHLYEELWTLANRTHKHSLYVELNWSIRMHHH